MDPGQPLLRDAGGEGPKDLASGGQAALVGLGVEFHLHRVVLVAVQVHSWPGRVADWTFTVVQTEESPSWRGTETKPHCIFTSSHQAYCKTTNLSWNAFLLLCVLLWVLPSSPIMPG